MNVRKMGCRGVWGWKWMSVVLTLSLVAQPVALSPLSTLKQHTEKYSRVKRSVTSDLHLFNVLPLCEPITTGEKLKTYTDSVGVKWEIQDPLEIIRCLRTTCAESSAIFENKRCECRERLQEHWSKVRKLNSTGPFDRFGLVLVPGSCTHVVTQFDEDQ